MRIKGLAAVIGLAILALVAASPAAAKDRNNDGIPDRWERKYDLSLKKNQARRDQDKDGARNKAEFRAKTSPRDADSDDDGTEDGDENAGTIESYDTATGVLVINLFGGETVSGLVDEETEIECGCRGNSEDDDSSSDDTPLASPGSGHEGSEDDDNSGPGSHDEDDDDNSGPGSHDEDDDDNSGPGSHHDDDDDNSGPGSACSTDDLVAGTAVHEAELKATANGLVYTEVELVSADPAGDDSDDDSSDD